MGMASSQVRLLMITNRLHDIEYKAACIQNAKILLGNLEDDAYKKYNDALEGANTITIGGEAARGMFGFDDLVNGLGVYMADNSGNVFVNSDAVAAYKQVVGDLKESTGADDYKKFSWIMNHKTSGQAYPTKEAKQPVFEDMPDTTKPCSVKEDSEEQAVDYYTVEKNNDGSFTLTATTSDNPKAVAYDANSLGKPDAKGSYSLDKLETAHVIKDIDGKYYHVKTAAQQLEDWKAGKGEESDYNYQAGSEFKTKAEVDAWEEFSKPDGTYISMFNSMSNAYRDGKNVTELAELDAHGLAQLLNESTSGLKLMNRSGKSGEAINNLSSGGWNVEIDPKNPFSYSVSTGEDKTAIAKASAEYENELRKIDRKEKQYDTELAKIETERNALTKEMEGLKKVKDDNVDRTFGIFS